MWAWFFVLVIVFRFVPISVVSRPVERVWSSLVAAPLAPLPYRARLALLWLAALAITFGSAFGFERPEVRVCVGFVWCAGAGDVLGCGTPCTLLAPFFFLGVSVVLTMTLGRAQR